MDLMEAPVEALVFRYSAATAGCLWAGIAVVAAALGLWRIRSSSSSPAVEPQINGPPPPSSAGPTPGDAPAAAPKCHVEGVGSLKGRFSVRFYAEEIGDVAAEVGSGTAGWSGGAVTWKWDDAALRGRGDLGWYRCQDMTVLNGNVVQLWNGQRGLITRRSQRGF